MKSYIALLQKGLLNKDVIALRKHSYNYFSQFQLFVFSFCRDINAVLGCLECFSHYSYFKQPEHWSRSIVLHSSPVRRTRSPFVWQFFSSHWSIIIKVSWCFSTRDWRRICQSKCSSVNGSGDFPFSRQRREDKTGSLIDKEKDINRARWEKTSRRRHFDIWAISSDFR